MGRITPSFRQLFHKFMEKIRFRKKSFYNILTDPENQKVFDLLLSEAWSLEDAAMSQSNIYPVTDIMNLMAAIHNKKCIEETRKSIEELERRIKESTLKRDSV